jgi:hypothetical protein
VASGDCALPVVNIEDYGLERLLAQPARREPGIIEQVPAASPVIPRIRNPHDSLNVKDLPTSLSTMDCA